MRKILCSTALLSALLLSVESAHAQTPGTITVTNNCSRQESFSVFPLNHKSDRITKCTLPDACSGETDVHNYVTKPEGSTISSEVQTDLVDAATKACGPTATTSASIEAGSPHTFSVPASVTVSMNINGSATDESANCVYKVGVTSTANMTDYQLVAAGATINLEIDTANNQCSIGGVSY